MARCPECKSCFTVGDAWDLDGSEVSQSCHCQRCEAEWTDYYKHSEADVTRHGDTHPKHPDNRNES